MRSPSNSGRNQIGRKQIDSRRPRSPGSSLAVICAILVAISLAAGVAVDWWWAYPPETSKTYVGSSRCIECHTEQHQQWQGSHHDLAMDIASDETVLGDFNDRSIEHFGITSRLYRDGSRFMVHTEGPDGKMNDFEIKYVFGVSPLQQYMVEIAPPTDHKADGLGKVQVLRISWDAVRGEWFYLSPPDVHERLAPADPLHWTGPAQNWNHMCAECHSTNLIKSFDIATMTYQTTFSDIDVGCEACHGPGSLHVDLANATSLTWDRIHGRGLPALKKAEAKTEIETCAPCHSRRNLVQRGFVCGSDYYNHYNNSLLTQPTYYPDGQILDEVYVYGSFLQSKMHANGIRCSDCHDPHTTKVKFDDNRLCTSCHQHHPAKYDTPAHHHHPAGSSGTLCIECHMMPTAYMDIDWRRDHSFQIPRPDLSLQLRTPNACTRCHLDQNPISPDKDAKLNRYQDWLEAARNGDTEVANALQATDAWAARHTATWYAAKTTKQERDLESDYAASLARAWGGDPQVDESLREFAVDAKLPGILRATAFQELANRAPSAATLDIAKRALADHDPQVRAEAIQVFQAIRPEERLPILRQLLFDTIRLVRIRAALALVESPTQMMTDEEVSATQASLKEYRQALLVHADQAASHMALAQLAEQQRDFDTAERHYRTAILVQPLYTGPRSNLSQLLERMGRTEEAAALRAEELAFMRRDAQLAPRSSVLQYRLGLSLYLNGELIPARDAIARAVRIESNNETYLLALALIDQKLERWDEARQSIETLIQIRPENQSYREIMRQIQAKRQPSG